MSVFHKTYQRRFRGALLASVFCMPAAHADSLTDAFVKAYQSNPQLMSERANLRATDEEVAQAIAQWRPRISISADYSKTDSENKDDALPLSSFDGRKREFWNADALVLGTK